MKKIYIAGKITGEPIRKCIAKFNNAEIDLYHKYRASNKRVFIPLHLPGIHFGIPHAEAIKICLEALKECTDIYMLKDWKDSPGARIEHEWAKNNGLKIIYEE